MSTIYNQSSFAGMGAGGHLTPNYYADFLREHTYPSMFFRQLGTQVTIPRGYGDKIKIPRWDKPITSVASGFSGEARLKGDVSAIQFDGTTSETPFVSSYGLSAEDITGSTVMFGGVRGYSSKFILVTRANYAEGALETLGREMAFKADRYTRAKISGVATLRLAGGLTKVAGTHNLYGKELARLAPWFDSYNVPRWDDNTFVGVTHPAAQYDLYRDISATGFVSVKRYGDTTTIYRGEVGEMFGIRLLLSNVIPLVRTTALSAGFSPSATTGLSSSVTGSHLWVFGPDVFYAIEQEGAGVEVLHMPPGSGGSTGDSLALKGTIGVKMMYGVAPNPSTDKRLQRFAYATTLHF